jgi:iron complex outermembrane receptor protein
VNDSYLNVNSQSTRGIDLTLRYEHEFDFGDLLIELSATHTMEDEINLFDPSLASGFATNDFSGTIGDPEWVGDASIRLDSGDFTYSWFIDYIGGNHHGRRHARRRILRPRGSPDQRNRPMVGS